jgi:transposase InsO family protein
MSSICWAQTSSLAEVGRPDQRLIHHSDNDWQYLAIRCRECLEEAGIEPSVDSVGDGTVRVNLLEAGGANL